MAGGLYLRGLRRPGLRAGLDRRLRAGRRSCSRPTCASSASSPCPTSSARATSGNLPRVCGVVVLFCASFTYIVAQFFGVGIITSRFLGIPLRGRVFVGLLGILVCSMLGGMRAVTWTQVAQYIILIIAYLVPVVWLSTKLYGIPIPRADLRPGAASRSPARADSSGIVKPHVAAYRRCQGRVHAGSSSTTSGR